jgi:hypothetical protein
MGDFVSINGKWVDRKSYESKLKQDKVEAEAPVDVKEPEIVDEKN